MSHQVFSLSEADKKTLLDAARRSIMAAVAGGAMGQAGRNKLSSALQTPCGAFVTLMKHGQLRGCIGYTERDAPLYGAVIRAARAAALEDTRFSPVTPDEIGDIHIEISVLSPPEPVYSPDEIELGKHGVILSKWGRRALFLPQVARKQGWDVETTLAHLAMKAGLGPYDWRDGATFEVFEAIVFGED